MHVLLTTSMSEAIGIDDAISKDNITRNLVFSFLMLLKNEKLFPASQLTDDTLPGLNHEQLLLSGYFFGSDRL